MGHQVMSLSQCDKNAETKTHTKEKEVLGRQEQEWTEWRPAGR